MSKKERCKECFDEGTVLVYFVVHSTKTVIEEWEFCTKCHPTSSAFFDDLPTGAEDISTEEAHRLIDEEKYTKHVP